MNGQVRTGPPFQMKSACAGAAGAGPAATYVSCACFLATPPIVLPVLLGVIPAPSGLKADTPPVLDWVGIVNLLSKSKSADS